MAAEIKGALSGATAQNSRTLLRVVILLLIASAAVASRLFSVIRKWPLAIKCPPSEAFSKHSHVLLLTVI